MELYKHKVSGSFYGPDKATRADVDQWLAERGLCTVPVEATRLMIDEAERVEEDGYHAMYEAMLQAAKGE